MDGCLYVNMYVRMLVYPHEYLWLTSLFIPSYAHLTA